MSPYTKQRTPSGVLFVLVAAFGGGGGFEHPLQSGFRREWGNPVQTIENCLRRASNTEREPKKRAGERRAATIEAEGR